MAGVYKGVNLVLTKGVAITNIPESTVFLGRGDIGSLPTPFVIMLGLTVLISIIAHRTPFRRYIYAIGDTWVLPSIAAAVIGGVATTGGIGSPIGAILGAGIIAIIDDVTVLYGISPYWQGAISGTIVVLAISFDALSPRVLFRSR
jgi:ribose transport system permease protein